MKIDIHLVLFSCMIAFVSGIALLCGLV